MTADRIRIWLSVVLLGLVMLGGFWIYEVMRRNSEDSANSGRVRTEPDYFVEHFNFVRISQSGNTNYRVTGQKLTHFPQEDEFEIQQPRIVGIDQEKTPMNIRADRAIVKQKVQEKDGGLIEDQIHLLDNVEVVRAGSATVVEVQLNTNHLVLYPDSERMRTDQAIVLKTPSAHITAVGIEADNARQTIRFLNQLRATINSKQTKQK
ncbi:LPS export ABC transporter periplasmic protein LptC [Undibacterium cyanobacteriorum]|uniref:LPS export ABC transporter periplasmic protein LptC n=1 Tax=Undibacterium cyanobacteriorum TaxID=3073561 RepID=A0ABY9RKP8_9BURK|nr:LPS export ABC transporter periplasmic protein LptC [Undibacterium sp. 20NA77.5]WMW81255.1 LPS export ABC transporter periplasmic protein LptC [Undibacterium sp. 20NA77.5]